MPCECVQSQRPPRPLEDVLVFARFPCAHLAKQNERGRCLSAARRALNPDPISGHPFGFSFFFSSPFLLIVFFFSPPPHSLARKALPPWERTLRSESTPLSLRHTSLSRSSQPRTVPFDRALPLRPFSSSLPLPLATLATHARARFASARSLFVFFLFFFSAYSFPLFPFPFSSTSRRASASFVPWQRARPNPRRNAERVP